MRSSPHEPSGSNTNVLDRPFMCRRLVLPPLLQAWVLQTCMLQHLPGFQLVSELPLGSSLEAFSLPTPSPSLSCGLLKNRERARAKPPPSSKSSYPDGKSDLFKVNITPTMPSQVPPEWDNFLASVWWGIYSNESLMPGADG